MTHRLPQIESTLQRAIAQVLQRQVSDPRIAGMVSITRVKVSPDLRDARVFVSVLPENLAPRSIHGLRDAARHIHAHVKKLVALRVVPHLDFRLDESLKKEAAVLDAINQGIKRTDPDQTETDE